MPFLTAKGRTYTVRTHRYPDTPVYGTQGSVALPPGRLVSLS
eukprot:SAG11_NODE_22753_length_400_cov_2.578073_1_plen_41_part_01